MIRVACYAYVHVHVYAHVVHMRVHVYVNVHIQYGGKTYKKSELKPPLESRRNDSNSTRSG